VVGIPAWALVANPAAWLVAIALLWWRMARAEELLTTLAERLRQLELAVAARAPLSGGNPDGPD